MLTITWTFTWGMHVGSTCICGRQARNVGGQGLSHSSGRQPLPDIWLSAGALVPRREARQCYHSGRLPGC